MSRESQDSLPTGKQPGVPNDVFDPHPSTEDDYDKIPNPGGAEPPKGPDIGSNSYAHDGASPPSPDGLALNDRAAAIKGNKKPGPADAPVQVRPSGLEAQATITKGWDAIDEAVDESFPASDASAKY